MPHWPARTDDSKYGIKARMHDAMSEKVIQAMSYSATHEGIQVAAVNPRGGVERQLIMHEPHWKALIEKHVIDYCAFRHPLMKTENIWVSEFGGSLLALLVTADVTESVSLDQCTTRLADTDTT